MWQVMEEWIIDLAVCTLVAGAGLEAHSLITLLSALFFSSIKIGAEAGADHPGVRSARGAQGLLSISLADGNAIFKRTLNNAGRLGKRGGNMPVSVGGWK